MKVDSDFDQGGGSGDEENWVDLRYILKVEPAKLAGESDRTR